MKLTLHEIAQVVGAKNDAGLYPDFALANIEFDSRKISQSDLFLPLRGARDGHDFIEVAFANGALATFSERPLAQPHLLVDDCLQAFQTLAAYYLKKQAVDVIAVTGSNGKTTTKDMIAAVLATTYQTYKTQGNYNNEIGLPYTVLHMPDDTEKIVLEMGQDHMGDIHLLSEIAQPRIAVVTLIGEAHLEFFGSREKIAQGKMQIADGMPAGGHLILPADKLINAYLPSQQELIRFGADQDIFLTELREQKDSLTFKVNFLETEIDLPVPGKYNATNAMLAAYVGHLCQVAQEQIAAGLAKLQLTKNRTEWLKAANGADILSDVYNANPTAMRLILETFSAIAVNEGGKKVAVLADMKELGPDSPQLHASIKSAISDNLAQVYLYGPDMAALAEAMAADKRVRYYADERDFDRLRSDIKDNLAPNDQVLFKGSNSMKLAQVVESLCNI